MLKIFHFDPVEELPTYTVEASEEDFLFFQELHRYGFVEFLHHDLTKGAPEWWDILGDDQKVLARGVIFIRKMNLEEVTAAIAAIENSNA